MSTATATMKCIVVTPEETVFDASADFVVAPLFDGEIGIAHNHSPMIGRLGHGELRVKSGGETAYFFVDGGFVQVADNVVSVMTNRAKRVEHLDPQEAELLLQRALAAPLVGGEKLAQRQREIDRARGMVSVAKRNR